MRWRSCFGALLAAAALAGCTIGPDEQSGAPARLAVTRDFGATVLERAIEPDVPGGETVMRFLQRNVDVETRYGGRFVEAIDGVRSQSGSGRRDWFYFVNGIDADVSAAEKRVHAGDRVWWDHREWSGAMRVPAVVGSFPEPFVHGDDGKRFPVRIDCAQGADEVCADVAERLDAADITPSTTSLGAAAGKDVLRFVIGEWTDVRADPAARQIEEGPRKSGVFAQIGPRAGGLEIEALDRFGRVARRLPPGSGLVAATRFEEQQPTWVVTGTDRAGLERAAGLVRERVLRNRYAVATDGERVLALPAGRGAEAGRR